MLQEGLVVITSSNLSDLNEVFNARLNQLGEESGVAQNLKGPITSVDKLLASPDQTLILYCTHDEQEDTILPIGFLKYGRKDLFFYTKKGAILEHSPVCLLDFYVSSAKQRGGIGHTLFSKMVEVVEQQPVQFAYDRPSPRLTTFLAKHHGLINADLQPNRFAIYDGFLKL